MSLEDQKTEAVTENLETIESTEKLWDEIGFHRPLAGFWYKIAFMLFSMIFGIALSGIYFKYLYPFPESMGYRTAATAIFGLFFSVFDLGTHMTMDRFIAESRIKNPARMVNYIQYFIWYQMITGLIQTTSVSIYALFVVPRSELAYAVWIMLLHSTTQYPGFLGVFRGTLNSLQQFNKTEVLNFVSGEVFQRITEILFILWGRQWGINNPEIGEIMGVAIGATIGFYIDDFAATALSAYYFQKVLGAEGITVRRCFQIDFGWELVRETLTFGVKAGLPHIIGLGAELIILWQWIQYVPQYTTFVTLFGLAGGISGLLNYGMGIPLTQLFAESYLNGKQNLTRYYIAQYIRFATMVQFFFIAIISIILLVLDKVYLGIGLDNYILSIPFIIPRVVRDLQQPFTTLADSIVTGTNHPNWLMFIRFAEEVMKVIFMTLWLVVLQLPRTYGITAIVWIMPCGIYPAIIIKTVASYWYIQTKILKIKILWWQTVGAPMIACIITYILGYFLKITVFDAMLPEFGIYPSIIVTIILIIVILIVGFFPLTVLFGSWDDNSIREFKKAALMSGPSKFLVVPMYKIVEYSSRLSPLHNKFGMDATVAVKEARELLAIKRSHQFKIG
jgi:hypothetical protein